MDFSEENIKEREYFKQDFSQMNKLVTQIRKSLADGSEVNLSQINLNGIVNFDHKINFTYITLFQEFEKPLRWGSLRETFNATINRNIEKIRTNPHFKNFDIKNSKKCRIMIEFVIEQTPTKVEEITTTKFTQKRFEPGITGLKLYYEGNTYVYMPTEAYIQSQMTLSFALNSILRKTKLKEKSNSISKRINLLKKDNYECFIIKSRAFVSYNDEILPLYRGNTLYEFSAELVKKIALSGANWITKNQQEDGKFLYYYDSKEDNFVDHEHPTRESDNLYYNDLRHCGGVVTLVRAYQLTKDERFLKSAKKALDFSTTITKEYMGKDGIEGYIHYNNKGKLGGTGLIVVAMMLYRNATGDKTYDKYIKKYVRHLLSRISESGEMFGYYIHPKVQNGNPLIKMTEEERRQTFSFYYPGEALLGLALFANFFEDDKDLISKVIEKSKTALDWIVDERPKIYADLFTALPSDSWLMQAIEEWCSNIEFRKENYINFVFDNAKTMMKLMYQKDDSPYIDYEGGHYYNYGDHYYPDGARSEGLIGAYYLAKKLGNEDMATSILETCKKTAHSQMVLYISDKNNYAHKNPAKSEGAIRFKATRQWVRVDSIQHVACFYFRLYQALV